MKRSSSRPQGRPQGAKSRLTKSSSLSSKKKPSGRSGLSSTGPKTSTGSKASTTKSAKMSPEDREILYLQRLLGIKSKRDVGEGSRFVEEFRNDGLGDFVDLLFDENSAMLSEQSDDDKESSSKLRPKADANAGSIDSKDFGGFAVEDFGDQDDSSQDDDSDDDEVSSDDDDLPPQKPTSTKQTAKSTTKPTAAEQPNKRAFANTQDKLAALQALLESDDNNKNILDEEISSDGILSDDDDDDDDGDLADDLSDDVDNDDDGMMSERDSEEFSDSGFDDDDDDDDGFSSKKNQSKNKQKSSVNEMNALLSSITRDSDDSDNDYSESDSDSFQNKKRPANSAATPIISGDLSHLNNAVNKFSADFTERDISTVRPDKSGRLVGLRAASKSLKYYPPALRQRYGIEFTVTPMRNSFKNYLSKSKGFIDTKNDADQNSFQYYGVLSTRENTPQWDYISSHIFTICNKISHLNVLESFGDLIGVLLTGDGENILENQPSSSSIQFSRGTFIDVFITTIIEFCASQPTLLSSTIQAIGCLCAGIHKVFGTQYGSLLLETVVGVFSRQVAKLYKSLQREYTTEENRHLDVENISVFIPAQDIAEMLHLADILGILYMMACTTSGFFIGFVEWMLSPSFFPDITKSSSSNDENLSPVDQACQWAIRCKIISHILMGFGIPLRKDNLQQTRPLLRSIQTDSLALSGNWATQQLIAILNDLNANRQYIPNQNHSESNTSTRGGKHAVSAAQQKADKNAARDEALVDYTSVREELFSAMNNILEIYNEDLLKKTDKKGRRETRKQLVAKAVAAQRTQQQNKRGIATKFINHFQLGIRFSDLLKVSETGRWWVVGAGFKQTTNMLLQDDQTNPNGNMNAPGISNGNGNVVDDDDDDDDDGADSLQRQGVATAKQLQQRADDLGFHTPLERFIFTIIATSHDHQQVIRQILTKHQHNQQHQEDGVTISPGQYETIANVIIQMCQSEPDYNSLFSGIFMLLLSRHPSYRFATCTSFGTNIKNIQQQSKLLTTQMNGIQRQYKPLVKQYTQLQEQLKKGTLPSSKQPVLKKMKAAIHAMTTKRDEIKTKQTDLSRKIVHLATLLADTVLQPSTLDLFALKSMQFLPQASGVVSDDDDDDDDDSSDDDSDEEGNNKHKPSSTSKSSAQIITPSDVNLMDDTTVLFLHTLLSRLVSELQSYPGEEAQLDVLLRIILPLFNKRMTNFLTMEPDYLKLKSSCCLELRNRSNNGFKQQQQILQNGSNIRELTRQEHAILLQTAQAVLPGNDEGKRIASCLSSIAQELILPTARQSQNGAFLQTVLRLTRILRNPMEGIADYLQYIT